MEALAAYLLYRMNMLNPICKLFQISVLKADSLGITSIGFLSLILVPAYLHVLPPGSAPIADLQEFLPLLARRMGMIRSGGEMDLSRAAEYFVRWWRSEGCLIAASEAQALHQDRAPRPVVDEQPLQSQYSLGIQGWGFDLEWEMRPGDIVSGVDSRTMIQGKMARCINDYMIRLEKEEGNVSDTQKRKMRVQEEKMKRKMKWLGHSS